MVRIARVALGGLAVGLAWVSGVSPARADDAIKPDWLAFDAAERVVHLTLVGAADGANGTMNWNGYGNGDMTVTVPLGWKVQVEFKNSGLGALPHSLVVIDDVQPLPVEDGKPAFPRAFTRRLVPGMMAPDGDSFDFTADREGRFLLLCGVTAHGAAGMWDYLVVTRETMVPRVAVKKR